MSDKIKIVKIKSILHCLLWCMKNGITKPTKWSLSKWDYKKFKLDSHNYFSYGKFSRCGNIYSASEVIGKPDYYECWGYEFHKDLLIFL